MLLFCTPSRILKKFCASIILFLVSTCFIQCRNQSNDHTVSSQSAQSICKLKINPESGMIDTITTHVEREQIFTLTGNNTETAEWSIPSVADQNCVVITPPSTGSSVRAIPLSKTHCKATIVAKTAQNCFARATLTVNPPVSNCDLNIHASDSKIIAANESVTYVAQGNVTKKNPVQWTIINPIFNPDCVSLTSQGTSVTVKAQNNTLDTCKDVVLQATSGNCVRHVNFTVLGKSVPECRLKKIDPQPTSPVASDMQITFKALDDASSPIVANWSIVKSVGCEDTRLSGVSFAETIQINTSNTTETFVKCALDIYARENKACPENLITLNIYPPNTVSIFANKTSLSGSTDDLEHADPKCFEDSTNSCVKVTLKNNSQNNIATAFMPTFQPIASSLHIQDATCGWPKNDKNSKQKINIPTSIPPNGTCEFYIYLKTGKEIPQRFVTLSVPYQYLNEPKRSAKLLPLIDYTVSKPLIPQETPQSDTDTNKNNSQPTPPATSTQ